MKISEILQDNFGIEIDDLKVGTDTTWSSQKIQNEFTSLEDSSHTHTNKSELDKITDGKVAEWDSKANGSHTHAKSEITDLFQVENSLASNSTINAISVAQAKLIDDKVTALQPNNHNHTNKEELDKIVSGKVASWDSKAEGTHTHNATDITEDTSHRFVTDAEKEKWDNSTEISDGTTTATSTWSSQKISEELKKATPSDYEQVKQSVEQNKTDIQSLKTEVGTSRINLVNNINSIIDIL